MTTLAKLLDLAREYEEAVASAACNLSVFARAEHEHQALNAALQRAAEELLPATEMRQLATILWHMALVREDRSRVSSSVAQYGEAALSLQEAAGALEFADADEIDFPTTGMGCDFYAREAA